MWRTPGRGRAVVDRLDRTKLEGTVALPEAPPLLGHVLQPSPHRGREVRQFLGRRHRGRRHLVVGPLLLPLERRRQVEDLLAVLDRDDAAVGEARAVAAAVHLVDDRRVEVAAPQEIRVQRMHRALGLDRAARGHQRLPEHLPAEHLRTADVAALAAEQVDLEPLEIEQLQQVGEHLAHAALTRSRRVASA